MGGPYSEKPWPKSLKWEGSIFQNGWQFFTIGKDPKPENKLFTFSSFSQIVFTLVKHFHKQRVRVTVTVRKSVQRYEPTRLQDLLPFSLGKKKDIRVSFITFEPNYRDKFREVISIQSWSSVWTIAQIVVHLDRRLFFNNRWTIYFVKTIYSFYSYAYYLTRGFRPIWKREELTPLLLRHQANSMKSN